jgi:hypothetical protein
MANLLACLALHCREIGATALVRAGEATLGCTQGASAIALIAAVIASTVVAMVV